LNLKKKKKLKILPHFILKKTSLTYFYGPNSI